MPFHSGLPHHQKRQRKEAFNGFMSVCVWCVHVCFISSISQAPSFQTLKLHKSQPLLLPPAPTCWALQADCLGPRKSCVLAARFWAPQRPGTLQGQSAFPLCISDPFTGPILLLPQTYWAWKQSLLYRSKHRVWKQFEVCLLMKAFGLFFL